MKKFVKWLVHPNWAQVELEDGSRKPEDVSKWKNHAELLKEHPLPEEPKKKK